MSSESELVRLMPTKRQLGAFYTPEGICKRLSEWAIRSCEDTILEPSFGQCGFISAFLDRLRMLGQSNPQGYIYGCDIDSTAFVHLRKELGLRNLQHRFLQNDFLSIRPSDFVTNKFTAVIGNPPYLPLSGMSHHQVEKGQEIIKSLNQTLQKRASIWAYFVIHSLSFLKEDGRTAWVLPRSLLFSIYGNEVRKILSNHFKEVFTIDYKDRLFSENGTEERTVILLCESFSTKCIKGKCIDLYTNSITDDLSNTSLFDWIETSTNNKKEDVLKLYNSFSENKSVKTFSEILKIKIGIVTGANKYFIISRKTASKLNLPTKFLKPILSKSKFTKGINLDLSTFLLEANDTDPIYLIDAVALKECDGELFERFLSSIPEDIKTSNKTFKKHNPWYEPDDYKIPDAFLVYMNQYGPRLILNNAKLNCTNSVHRLYFKSQTSLVQQKLISISMMTSYTQLSAEIEGRNYGTGVLKIEPSDGNRIKFLLPDNLNEVAIEETYNKVDGYLRLGNFSLAYNYASNFIYEALGIERWIGELNETLEFYRSMRIHK